MIAKHPHPQMNWLPTCTVLCSMLLLWGIGSLAHANEAILQQAYLKAANAEARDEFGFAVAMSADTLVVGAPGEDGIGPGSEGDPSDNGAQLAGAVYVYDLEDD